MPHKFYILVHVHLISKDWDKTHLYLPWTVLLGVVHRIQSTFIPGLHELSMLTLLAILLLVYFNLERIHYEISFELEQMKSRADQPIESRFIPF